MIRKISGLVRLYGLVQAGRGSFCSKAEILKTYLEIIPPHKIYELKEKKEHRLENALTKL